MRIIMKSKLIVLSLLVCVESFSFTEKFRVCKKSDPEFNKCLAIAIENGFKTLATGIPEINVPGIDPLTATKLVLGAGTTAVHLDQHYFNSSLLGLSNLKVETVNFDFKTNTASFTTSHPSIIQEAKYQLNGKILILPVYGNGDSRISFQNSTVTHVISLGDDLRNNKHYFKVLNYAMTLSPKHGHFDFKNLFDGDKRLGDNILTVINENWKEIYADVKLSVEKSYSQVFKNVATALLRKVPIDVLFPN